MNTITRVKVGNPPIKVKKKKLKPSLEKKEAMIQILKESAYNSGYKKLTVAGLLKTFGYSKRSDKNITEINNSLSLHGLTSYPALTLKLKFEEPVKIYCFPVVQLGDLFEDTITIKDIEGISSRTGKIKTPQQRERSLEHFIEKNELFSFWNLRLKHRQHSPQCTRDRFDFLCTDCDGNEVLLELKYADGGKSSVEQVLRYIGTLKLHDSSKKARAILVTGIRDINTAKALHGMEPEQQAKIDWYLYKYDNQKKTLDFELVSYEFIAKSLKPILL